MGGKIADPPRRREESVSQKLEALISDG